MVGNPPYPSAIVIAGYILLLTGLSNSFNDGKKNIDVKVAVNALKHRACAFESHACVYVSAWKRSKVVGWIADTVVLCKYQIPYFNFTTIGHSVENFTAGSANAVGTL